MPAKSARQQRAAGADLRRMREGKKPRTFKGASQSTVRHFAMSKAKRSRKVAELRAGGY